MRQHLCFTLLLALAACKPHPAPPPAAKLPFDISPKTTAITAPLRPDGTPDYAAAFNQKYGAGVTPQTNGFLLILQAFGTDTIKPEYRAEALQLCASPEFPTPDPPWESYIESLKRRDPKSLDKLSYEQFNEDDTASKSIWTRSQHPLIADYLDAHTAQFDLIARAVRMPQFWQPVLSSGPSWFPPFSEVNANLRRSSFAFQLRALLRLGSNDFEGFLTDFETLKHIARCLATHPLLINGLMALSVEESAHQLSARAAVSGKLSLEQCDRLRNSLNSFRPIPPLQECWQIGEKWQALAITTCIATRNTESLKKYKAPDAWFTIDPARVDWNAVLSEINRRFDAQTLAAVPLSLSQLQAKDDETLPEVGKILGPIFKQALDGEKVDAPQVDPIGSIPGTTREDYSRNVTDNILSLLLMPNLTYATERNYRKCQFHHSLLPPLLALARHRASTGTWPKTFADIPSDIRAAFPIDPFAPDNAPIQYTLSPAGPSLSSVGPDGKPKQPNSLHDDIGLGADTSLR